MTEEEFWHTNVTKIKVYEKAWMEEQNRENQLNYQIWGNYGLSAMVTALSQVLTPMFSKGKRSHQKYMDEPFRLFEKTEDEKQAEKEAATRAFIKWTQAQNEKIAKRLKEQ